MSVTKSYSQRQLRVGEEIRHVLADIMIRNDWPVGSLKTPVTVTQVDVSPDLQNALVFVMPLGGADQEQILDFLTEMTFYMRKILGKKVALRRVPTLKFLIDETFDQAEKIDLLLKRAY